MKFRDRLRDHLPEGVSVEEAETILDALEAEFNKPGGTVSDNTFSKADLDAAVAAAQKPLQDQIDAHEQSASEAEIAERIEAVKVEGANALEALKAEHVEALSEFEKKVDVLDLAKTAAEEAKALAEKELEDAKAYLTAKAEEAAEAEATEARKGERVEAVKAAVDFSEERLAENADRWAAMGDDEFAALLGDYKDMKPKTAPASGPPATTQLVPGAPETENASSNLSAVSQLRAAGIDPTQLR